MCNLAQWFDLQKFVVQRYMQFCYLEAISYIAKCTNCNIFPKDDAGTPFGAFILYPYHRK